MAEALKLWHNAQLYTCDGHSRIIARGALLTRGSRIEWVGDEAALPGAAAHEVHDLSGALVTPGLIDSHTHLVFAGTRATEYAERLRGRSYEEIALAGGGMAFSVAQAARLFEAARTLGLPVKMHAEQLSNLGGTLMAAGAGALSCDHLEYAGEAEAAALARAGTVAVLLPIAYYYLAPERRPPLDALRAHRVALAVASDCNPGSAPAASLLTAMSMATRLFGLTAEEALLGAGRGAHAVTARLAAGDAPVYGINTGFGLLANTRIAPAQRTLLQRNIILSHSAGVGPLLDDAIVRLTLVLKLASLLQGFSGVSPELARFLERLINAGLCPCVPAQGSVGASGDLAPLAHLSLAVLGLGDIRRHGEVLPAAEALAQEALAPLALGPKEGLALLNGTQVSTALALAGLFEIETVFAGAVVSGALSLDALQGSDAPFDPRMHHLRGHDGQARVAQVYRELLSGSEIRESHRTCTRVQDPYSLRCQPQVMGACLDLITQQAATLTIEANAVTDNPLIFPDTGEVLSGGNFHAEPVAFAADILALACAEVGSIAERRLALLVDPKMSGLPAFLAPDSGVNSGFMLAQVTAAALVAENRMLCHPASVDSIPTSANHEDHVSMATHGARRLLAMAGNALNIVALEFLAACQGVDLRAPLETWRRLQDAHSALRLKVPFAQTDRLLAPDVADAAVTVRRSEVQSLVAPLLPSFR